MTPLEEWRRLNDAELAAAMGQPPPVLRKGTRFYSSGLCSYCVVVSIDLDNGVIFRTENGAHMCCDVPLDVAVALVRAGRWDVVPAPAPTLAQRKREAMHAMDDAARAIDQETTP